MIHDFNLSSENWRGDAPEGYVLVVDDDDEVRIELLQTLVGNGFQAMGASRGEEALRLFEHRKFDLVLLDGPMPGRPGMDGMDGMDGYEVCRTLRAGRPDAAIILLTKSEHPDPAIRGLAMGADACLGCPLGPDELLEGVRAVLKRTKPAPAAIPQVQFRNLKLDYRSQRCFKNGSLLDLTPTEFQLLAELCASKGQVVPRAVLIKRIWGEDHHVSAKSLEVYIGRLRQKVEDDPGAPRLIKTVRGIGYLCE